jgi:hypothetical protein
MTPTNFTTQFSVANSATEVFHAINNVRGWWQGEIEGPTAQLNDEFIYRMKEIHYSKQKIEACIPDQKVVWLVTDSNLNFTQNKSEWTGTKIIFEIAETNKQTQLCFIHAGLVPAMECYGGCSSAWEKLIQESLFGLITTGKGANIFG